MPGSLHTRWIVFFVCGALSVLGCVGDTDAPQGETGALSLNLELGDVDINEVRWEITRPGMPNMDGWINTSAPGSKFTAWRGGAMASPRASASTCARTASRKTLVGMAFRSSSCSMRIWPLF